MKVRVWTRGYPSEHEATFEVDQAAEDVEIAREVRARYGAFAAVAEIMRPKPSPYPVEEIDEDYARTMSFRDNS